MRPVREISAKEENFRTEQRGQINTIRRDPVEPEPVGTYVLLAFRITGYDPDCDGSLMARLEQVSFSDPKETTGWRPNQLGLYPDTEVVVTEEELRSLPKEDAIMAAVEKGYHNCAVTHGCAFIKGNTCGSCEHAAEAWTAIIDARRGECQNTE